MTARVYAFLGVSGLMLVFISMLTVSMLAYGKRIRAVKASKEPRPLPIHVFLMALSFLMAKTLNFATIAYDTYDPVYQFPFWIRIPWDLTATVIGIVALKYLLTYERLSRRHKP